MRFALCAILLLLVLPLRTGAAAQPALEQLLASAGRPEGVVFEIIAWRDRTWDWAAPQLRVHVEHLRARFPGLDMALVSRTISRPFALRGGRTIMNTSALPRSRMKPRPVQAKGSMASIMPASNRSRPRSA